MEMEIGMGCFYVDTCCCQRQLITIMTFKDIYLCSTSMLKKGFEIYYFVRAMHTRPETYV